MKRHLGLCAAAIGLLTGSPVPVRAQLPAPTYGWNLGNTLEPPGGEGSWAPPATRALIDSVAAAGFNTVRIPCSWNAHANSRTHRIEAAYLARVQEVVDWCYGHHLHVIINDHWDAGWFQESGFARVDPALDAKLRSYWTQIAEKFRDYDDHLLFACANEPAVDSEAKTGVLLKYYQGFVEVVRATGARNAARWLVLQGPDTNIDKTCNWMNRLPSDPTPGRLMVEVHYYDPYQYCLMTSDAAWGKIFYFWGRHHHSATRPERNATSGEESAMKTQFRKMNEKFVRAGIPVLLGEFAAIRRTSYPDLQGKDRAAHLASRIYFDQQVIECCKHYGLNPVYWDDGGTGNNACGIFDRQSGAVADAASARALTGGPAASP